MGGGTSQGENVKKSHALSVFTSVKTGAQQRGKNDDAWKKNEGSRGTSVLLTWIGKEKGRCTSS